MPRSRSRSIVSSTCSRIKRLSSVPVSSISRSARVDFPWSMWATMQKLRMWSWRIGGNIAIGHWPLAVTFLQTNGQQPTAITQPRPTSLAPLTGWFDPAQKGGFLRLAANSYLPGQGDAAVKLPGLRRGDLVVLEDGRVRSANGLPPERLEARPAFADLGAVHPKRPLILETPRASSPRTAETQRVVDLICPFGFGQRALIVS